MITYKIDNLPKRPRIRRKTNEERNRNIDEYKEEVIDNKEEFERLKEESNDLFISDNNIEENNEDYNFLEDLNKKEEIEEDDDIDIYAYDKSLYEDIPDDEEDIVEEKEEIDPKISETTTLPEINEDLDSLKKQIFSENNVTDEIIEEPKINNISTLPEIDEDLDALKKQIFSENKIADEIIEEPIRDEKEEFAEEVDNNIEETFDNKEEIKDNINDDENAINLRYDEPTEELNIGSFIDDEDLEDEKFLYENMFYEKESNEETTEDNSKKK